MITEYGSNILITEYGGNILITEYGSNVLICTTRTPAGDHWYIG